MRTPRFSIRSLLAAIAVAGVVLAMLRSSLPVWANAAHTVAIVAIVAGASSAILSRDARRAYWVGFSLFGATYLMTSDQLVTETMLDLLYPYLAPDLSLARGAAGGIPGRCVRATEVRRVFEERPISRLAHPAAHQTPSFFVALGATFSRGETVAT